jgi:hypothetical protein
MLEGETGVTGAKKIANNTLLIEYVDGMEAVKFHSTIVATLHHKKHKEVTLNCGRWKTMTTKARINDALEKWLMPFRIDSVRGEWYVYGSSQDGYRFPFYNGITFGIEGPNPFPDKTLSVDLPDTESGLLALRKFYNLALVSVMNNGEWLPWREVKKRYRKHADLFLIKWTINHRLRTEYDYFSRKFPVGDPLEY